MNRAKSASQRQSEEALATKQNADPTPAASIDGPATATDIQMLQDVKHPTARSARQRAVQRIGRTSGNQALLQRGFLDWLTGGDQAREAENEDPEQAALQEFLNRGMMPSDVGKEIIGPGGLGGFNAKFDPESRALIVTVNIGITFAHGLAVDPTTGNVTADTTSLQAGRDASEIGALQNAAAGIMADTGLDKQGRIDEVNNNWRWGNDEKQTWMDDYRNTVQNAWGGQHYFQSKRWEELMANVNVVVNVHSGSQANDHCQATIIKTPPGALGAVVYHGTGASSTDQAMVMSSSGIGPSATNFLQYSLQFENNSADINTATGIGHGGGNGKDYLDKFIADFGAGYADAGDPIQITGRANATGDPEHNQRLSEERARNVENYLTTNGLTGSANRTTDVGVGSSGADEDPSWRRVDIQVGSGEAQNTAAHEFGHIIGLGDEYASPATGFYPGAGTPVPIGNPATHDALAQKMGGGVRGAVAENSDSIMSVGNSVRPQHYATFFDALQKTTGEQWEYGGSLQGTELPAVGGPNAGGGDTALA